MCKVFLKFLFLLICMSGCKNEKRLIEKSFIHAGNFKVYYEKKGKGDAVVLLHAGLQNSSMWKEQVKDLSQTFSVITIDLPYHGKTSGTDTTLLAKEVIHIVLDSLGLKKVSLAGLSMGASVVQDL